MQPMRVRVKDVTARSWQVCWLANIWIDWLIDRTCDDIRHPSRMRVKGLAAGSWWVCWLHAGFTDCLTSSSGLIDCLMGRFVDWVVDWMVDNYSCLIAWSEIELLLLDWLILPRRTDHGLIGWLIASLKLWLKYDCYLGWLSQDNRSWIDWLVVD